LTICKNNVLVKIQDSLFEVFMATKTRIQSKVVEFENNLGLPFEELTYLKERKRLGSLLWDSDLFNVFNTEHISEIFRQYWNEKPELAVWNTFEDIKNEANNYFGDCFPQPHLKN
jgi:hypothetical protein